MKYPYSPAFFDTILKNRLLQHVVFWLVIVTYLTIGFKHTTATIGRTLHDVLWYLPGLIFLVYSFLYFLIPFYLVKRKFLWFFTGLILIVSVIYITYMDTQLFGRIPTFSDMRIFARSVFLNFSICSIAIAIKFFKYWYLEKEAKQQAERANLTSQLQLLKSQVHPHFLFNTLNNLYSLTLEHSAEAPSVVLQLSTLLRYMLYECDTNEILLEKEIEIINNYIKLEQIRYGKRLDISVNYTGDITGKMIAPLLLLPFFENCFKHGTSEQLEQCWISVDINVSGDDFNMKLTNSKHITDTASTNTGGIGLENVKKRLDLLYKAAHLLKLTPEEETYTVSLNIKLAS
ncbi:MAG: histidine kinase [Bacteroidota bacterium]|nr:histidine kinase [Bacteroidota bacterium]